MEQSSLSDAIDRYKSVVDENEVILNEVISGLKDDYDKNRIESGDGGSKIEAKMGIAGRLLSALGERNKYHKDVVGVEKSRKDTERDDKVADDVSNLLRNLDPNASVAPTEVRPESEVNAELDRVFDELEMEVSAGTIRPI